MRLFFIGPRIFGVRPGVSFKVGGRSRVKPDQSGKQFVYVIRGEHGMSKIGISTNPEARLSALQTGSAHPLSFAYVATVAKNALSVEQKAHTMLRRHRTTGEWFDIPTEMAVGALNAAASALGDSLTPVGENAIPGASVGEDVSGSVWPLAFVVFAPLPILIWLIAKFSDGPADVAAFSVGVIMAYLLLYGAAKVISKVT